MQPDTARRHDLVVQRLLKERVAEPIGDRGADHRVLLHQRRTHCIFERTLEFFIRSSMHAPQDVKLELASDYRRHA